MAPPPVVCLSAVLIAGCAVIERVIPPAASQGECSLSGEPSPNPVDSLAAYLWNPVQPVDIRPAVMNVLGVLTLYGANKEAASIVPLVAFGQEDSVTVVTEAPLVLFAAGVCCCDVFDVCHVMFSGWCAPLHTPNRT